MRRLDKVVKGLQTCIFIEFAQAGAPDMDKVGDYLNAIRIINSIYGRNYAVNIETYKDNVKMQGFVRRLPLKG